MTDHLFLRACRGEFVPRTPVWMMRQAGRYMPEYQAVRSKVTFLDLCKTPELACQVTLQPIDAFGFDAAILFCDILIPLEAMGMALEFTDEGPHLPKPIGSGSDVDRLAVPDPAQSMRFVLDAVTTIRRALADRVPLIGFAGAPFTMATYAIEGGGSKNYAKTKGLLYEQPEVAHRLFDKLARTTALYLEAQIAAGAQAVQLFDSWGGILSPRDFREVALRYASQVFRQVRDSSTFKKTPVPIIYFVNGCAPYLADLKETGADVIGVDWRVDLGQVRKALGPTIPVQGNLDPTALFLPAVELRERIAEVLRGGAGPGHIFNLGHGILPMTRPTQVKLAVEAVRELSSKQ